MKKIKFKKLKKQKTRNICNMGKTWQCNNFFFSKFIHPKINQWGNFFFLYNTSIYYLTQHFKLRFITSSKNMGMS